jgi:hypothetical protein
MQQASTSGNCSVSIAMKHFSFRILLLCILLPPLCYGVTIQALAHYLTSKFSQEIEEISTGDVTPLFQGMIRLKDAVRSNIDQYLDAQPLLSWGVGVNVLVTAGNQTILYPAILEKEPATVVQEKAKEIAGENYLLLNDGLTVTVDVKLPLYQVLPNIILAIYISIAVAFLYGFYQRSIRKETHESEEINRRFEQLRFQEKENFSRLEALKREREVVAFERDRLKNTLEDEKTKAISNESELFQEIIQLDEKLSENLTLQDQQQSDIAVLREQIETYEKDRKKSHKIKVKEMDMVAKRFKALYKHIIIHDRAIEGFLNLTEEMQLKGEELIHRLNESPDQVTIKRKVFSGKGREAVLEVLFGYNGRLYFKKTKQTIEIITIGNKNTQSKDLEFVDKFSKRA